MNYADEIAVRYAENVISGAIPACQKIIRQAKRFLSDIAGEKYIYDRRRVRLFHAFSRLCCHVKGDKRGEPIELADWQIFAAANLFGIVRKDGRRKYRTAFVLLPRKNGKSTFASIIGLFCLLLDGKQANVHCAATTYDQARIVFDDAKAMVRASPELKRKIKPWQYHLSVESTNSTFAPCTSKAGSLEGLNPSMGILDETHAHPDDSIWSVMELAMGARPNGVLFSISTAGVDLVGICKRQYDYAERVLDGRAEDDSFLPLIYELDEGDDYTDPNTWIKANPNLGISVDSEDLQTMIKRADETPAAKNMMLTKRFNKWCAGSIGFISLDKWRALAGEVKPANYDPVFIGLDLSSKQDITAVTLLFPDGDNVRVTGRYYLPEARAVAGDNRNANQYRAWAEQGHLILTHGEVISYDIIRDDLINIMDNYDVQAVCFDPWNSNWLIHQIGENAPIVPVRQGFISLSPACKELQVYTLSGRIVHDNNPILNWAMGNVTLDMDAAGNIKPDKLKSENKIDPVASLVCAFARYAGTLQEGVGFEDGLKVV